MVSEPKDVQHFRFKQLRKLRIFHSTNNESEIPQPCRLVAVSNKYGLIFVGHPKGFKVLKLSDVVDLNVDKDLIRVEAETYPSLDVYLPTAPSHLAVSCDDLTLAVSISHDQCPYICLYDIRGFGEAKSHDPFNGIRLSADPGTTVSDIAWNPAVGNVLAANLSNGSVTMYELSDTSMTICGSLPPTHNVKAICWSPKGKQIIVGKGDGTLSQHKPTLQEVKSIPSPNIFENPVSVLNISWLSSFCFAVTYQYPNDGERPFLVIVNTPKNGNITYINYDDVTYSSSDQRRPQYSTLHQPEWGVLLCASSNSMEVGVLGVSSEDKTLWEQWCVEDSGRAELPLDGSDEVYPTGMDVCYNSLREIPLDENMSLPPMPIFFIMSTKGSLCPFHMINSAPGAMSLVRQAQTLAPDGLRPGKPMFVRPQVEQQAPIVDHPARPHAIPTSRLINMPPNTTTSSVPSPASFKPQPEPQSGAASQALPASHVSFSSTTSPSAAASSFTFPVGQDSQNNARGGIMSGIPVTSTLKLNPVTTFSGQAAAMPASYTTTSSSSIDPPTSRGILPNLNATSQNRTVPSAFQPTSAAINKNASLSLSGMETPLKHSADGTPLAKQVSKPAPEAAISSSGSTSRNIFTSAIMEEMTNFNKELLDLKEKTRTTQFIVASDDEKRVIKEKLEDISAFKSGIKETTHSLNQDIHSLRIRTLESFAALEEARSLQHRNRDPRYRQLLQTRSLDPNSRKKMKTIWQCYHYIESQIRAVHNQLDEEWENYQAAQKKKAKKLYIPSIEAIYQTVLNMQNVLATMPHKLNQLQEMLNQVKVSGMLSLPPGTGEQSPLNRPADISSLSDRLLRTKLSDSTKMASNNRFAAPKPQLSAAKEAKLRNILGNRLVTPVRSSAPGNLSRLLLPDSILQVTRRQSLLSDSMVPSSPSFSQPPLMSTPVSNSFRPVWPTTPSASLTSIPSASGQTPLLFTSLAARSDGPSIQVPTAVSQPRSVQGSLPQPTAQTTTSRFGGGLDAWPPASSTANVTEHLPTGISGVTALTSANSSSFMNSRVSGAVATLSSGLSSNFGGQPFAFGGATSAATTTSSVVPPKLAASGFPLPKFSAKPFDNSFVFNSSSSAGTKQTSEAESSGSHNESPKQLQFKPVETGGGGSQESSTPFSFGGSASKTSFTFGSSSSNGVFQFGSAKKSNNRADSALSSTSPPKETESKFPSKPFDSPFTFSSSNSTATKPKTKATLEAEVPSSLPAAATLTQFKPVVKTSGSGSEDCSTSFSFAEASLVKPEVTTDELKPYDPNLEDVTPPSTPTEEIENLEEENGEGSVKDGLLEKDEIREVEAVTAESVSASGTSEVIEETLPSYTQSTALSSVPSSTTFSPQPFSPGSFVSTPIATAAIVSSSPVAQQFGSVTITPIATQAKVPVLPTNTSTSVTAATPATAASALGAALLAAANSSADEPTVSSVGQVITVSPQSSAVGGSGEPIKLTLKFGQSTVVTSDPAVTSTVSSVSVIEDSVAAATGTSTTPAFGTLPATIAPAVVFGAKASILATSVGTFGQVGAVVATGTAIKFGQQTTSTSVFGQSTPTAAAASEFSFTQLAAATSPTATTASTTGFGSPQTSTTGFGFGSPTGAPLTSFAPGSTNLFGGGAATTSGASPPAPAFGATTAASTTAPFGQKPLFGQSAFETPSSTSTFGQTASPPCFGQSKQVFGQTGASSFGQSSPPNMTAFGTQQQASAPMFGGQGGLFSGLGGKPNPENANKNVFGGVAAFGSTQAPSLFGNQDRTNAFSNKFGSSFSGGSFSSGGSSVAQTGFGGFQSPQQQQQQQQQQQPQQQQQQQPQVSPPGKSAFGGTPAFGGSPLFSAAPAFGSAPSFGNVPGATGFGSPQPTAAAGFGSFAASNTSPTFGALAAQTPSPGFGSAASQANVPGFGTLAGNNPGFGNASFGQSPPPAFGGTPPSFGSSGNSTNASFSQWRA